LLRLGKLVAHPGKGLGWRARGLPLSPLIPALELKLIVSAGQDRQFQKLEHFHLCL
jgi:hypothetical protein